MVIGDLIKSGVTQNDLSVTRVAIVVSTIGILQVGISYLGFRVRRLRPFLQGEPIVPVENGRLIDRNLRRERLTLDDLAEKVRMSEIASINEIKWASWKPTAISASSSNRAAKPRDPREAAGFLQSSTPAANLRCRRGRVATFIPVRRGSSNV